MKSLVIGVLASVLALVALRGARGQQDELVLQDGFTLTGKVTGCSADSVDFERKNEKGEMVVEKYSASDLDPDAFYALRVPRCTTAADQLELAKFALAHDMWARAILHYGQARELDPKLLESFDEQELPALREAAGDRLVASAKKAFEAGDLASAERDASVVVAIFRKYSKRADAQALLGQIRAKGATPVIEQTAADRSGASAQGVTLLLQNGHSLTGRVASSTPEQVVLVVPTKGTDATLTLKTKDLDPASFYSVRAAAVKSADDRMNLAKFCLTNGLYPQARAQAQLANAADPAMVKSFIATELPKLEEGTAQKLLEQARRSLANGDAASARRDVSAILTRFGETKAAGPAYDLIGEIAKGTAATQDAAAAAARAKATGAKKEGDERVAQAREKTLADVDALMDQAAKKSQEGFDNARKSKAKDEFQDAAGLYEKARSQLTELKKAKAEDAELVGMIDQRLQQATDLAVEAWVNAGSVMMTRSDFHNASIVANKALAVDPGSSYAKAFRARVEEAIANQDRDWGLRRRR